MIYDGDKLASGCRYWGREGWFKDCFVSGAVAQIAYAPQSRGGGVFLNNKVIKNKKEI